ncbi:hypothetical protein HK099_004704 [Clydaea vesicula]|uniref:Uncharacterized protein n=1 Tax=Clydaea vesicula TaxID=447962 RepID=A0AAD5U6S4_9FUNG|nr:hypothetical protein HK099_004704 [Clydaea vesicula]
MDLILNLIEWNSLKPFSILTNKHECFKDFKLNFSENPEEVYIFRVEEYLYPNDLRLNASTIGNSNIKLTLIEDGNLTLSQILNIHEDDDYARIHLLLYLDMNYNNVAITGNKMEDTFSNVSNWDVERAINNDLLRSKSLNSSIISGINRNNTKLYEKSLGSIYKVKSNSSIGTKIFNSRYETYNSRKSFKDLELHKNFNLVEYNTDHAIITQEVPMEQKLYDLSLTDIYRSRSNGSNFTSLVDRNGNFNTSDIYSQVFGNLPANNEKNINASLLLPVINKDTSVAVKREVTKDNFKSSSSEFQIENERRFFINDKAFHFTQHIKEDDLVTEVLSDLESFNSLGRRFTNKKFCVENRIAEVEENSENHSAVLDNSILEVLKNDHINPKKILISQQIIPLQSSSVAVKKKSLKPTENSKNKKNKIIDASYSNEVKLEIPGNGMSSDLKEWEKKKNRSNRILGIVFLLTFFITLFALGGYFIAVFTK